MKAILSTAVWAVAALACAGFAASGQEFAGPAQKTVGNEIVRQIEDPATGNRWVLERDGEHPGGPGRLLLVQAAVRAAAGAHGSDAAMPPPLRPPVIRAGEPVTLVAHTAVLDAELEGVALAAAAAGSALQVRLKIGGRVVEAVALGAGRAEWSPKMEGKP